MLTQLDQNIDRINHWLSEKVSEQLVTRILPQMCTRLNDYGVLLDAPWGSIVDLNEMGFATDEPGTIQDTIRGYYNDGTVEIPITLKLTGDDRAESIVLGKAART